MNAHQRRKSYRRLLKSLGDGSKPVLIRGWVDLAKVPDSKTHRLEIDIGGCNGWIHEKENGRQDDFPHYLSTHTFYGSQHKYSTLRLRKCGFNVTIENWDKP